MPDWGAARHRSFRAPDVTSTSGENRYSRMRRLPVFTSTVTAIPGVRGAARPSISIDGEFGRQRHWEHEILRALRAGET